MLESPPLIAQTSAVQTAFIHLVIPHSEMRSKVGPAIGELMAAVRAQGGVPAGALFMHHLGMHSDHVDVELGVPVSSPFVSSGRVQPGSLPATRVARAVHMGDYGGLPSAWSALLDWVAEQRLDKTADLWESYVQGPQANPDPSTWRTELNQPLLD